MSIRGENWQADCPQCVASKFTCDKHFHSLALLDLAGQIDAGKGSDNKLDVLVEVALFEPDEEFVSCRANSAGTKVIYKSRDDCEFTFWAVDWTKKDRAEAAAALRAKAGQP